MYVSFSSGLDDGRPLTAIGRIRAATRWRAAGDPGAEADRRAAIEALTREAEEYGADAVVEVRFEVDGVKGRRRRRRRSSASDRDRPCGAIRASRLARFGVAVVLSRRYFRALTTLFRYVLIRHNASRPYRGRQSQRPCFARLPFRRRRIRMVRVRRSSTTAPGFPALCCYRQGPLIPPRRVVGIGAH